MYEIDSADKGHGDKAFLSIDNTKIDLGLLGLYDDEVRTGEVDGIIWSSHYRKAHTKLGFTDRWVDQKHTVTLTIPPTFYSDGKIILKIEANLNEDIDNESIG